MEQLELRVIHSSITVNDNDLCVEGLVNKSEAWSHTLGKRKKFREKITRGAFSKAIQSADRIDFLVEHDVSKVLSTTENRSLELWEDEEGLKIRAKICPTTYGRDIYELLSHGIFSHMSFGFRAISDKWKKLSDGTFERIVDALELLEVSVVRNPAYPQSMIAARGIELVEEANIPEDVLEERSQEDMDKETIQEFRSLITNVLEKIESLEKRMEETSEAPKADKAKVDEVKVEEVKTEEVKADETKSDETKPEETKVDEAKVDETEVEKAKTDEVEKDENRSFDLASYRQRIKERR